jgi:hypothetical protein
MPRSDEIIQNNWHVLSAHAKQADRLPELQERSKVSAHLSGSTISHGWQDPLKNVSEFLGQAGFDENRRTSHSLRVRLN